MSPQPPNLHICIASSSQHLLFVPRHSRSAAYIILVTYITNRSFRYASLCLWNQLHSSLRVSHHSLSLTCLFLLLLLVLLTHHFHHPLPLTLSMAAQNLPHKSFPPDSLLHGLASGLTPRTLWPFLLSISFLCSLFSTFSFSLVRCRRLSWLSVRTHVNIVYRSKLVMYHWYGITNWRRHRHGYCRTTVTSGN